LAKVSVIIPVYNIENYLKQSMNSVINQTLKDIEIICIDDCSTDNSLKILEEYAQKDSRIKILRQKINQGQGIARNCALDIAQGEYIMFLDPDDWFEPDACEIAYNHISKNQNDFSYFNLYHYNDSTGKTCIDTKRLKPFLKLLDNPKIKFSELTEPFMSYGECIYKIYKREFLEKYNIRFTSMRCCEDVPFYMKAIVNAGSVSVIDRPLYYYRFRETSTIANLKNKFFIFYARKISYDYILASERKDVFLKYYLIAYIKSLAGFYRAVRKRDDILDRKFYIIMRRVFKGLAQSYDIEQIKDYINYDKFQNVLNKSWEQNFKVYIDIPNIIKCRSYSSNYLKIILLNRYKIITKKLFVCHQKEQID